MIIRLRQVVLHPLLLPPNYEASESVLVYVLTTLDIDIYLSYTTI